MPSLLIDMPSGIAGDMLLAALLDLGGDRERLLADLATLGCGAIAITATRVQPSGLSALQVDVVAEQDATWRQPGAAVLSPAHHGQVPHRPWREIRDRLARAPLPTRVIARAQRVFRVLAEAEAHVHGVDPEHVEFHEVGAIDAIADVVGCCLLLEQLGIDQVLAGPLLPGEGSVACAHGRMPVPVPAVAQLLAQHRVPQRRLGRETGELTTPTGCALVIGLADGFISDESPALVTTRVGYGAGHKTIAGMVNVLRVHLIETAPTTDRVAELRCVIDDMSGEALAVATGELLAAGALDVWLSPIVMKKGRPGHELTVLATPADRERIAALMLARTSAIGLRWQLSERMVLPRRLVPVEIAGQRIGLKIVTLPDGSLRAKPEASDVAAAAVALGVTFSEMQQRALAAWRP